MDILGLDLALRSWFGSDLFDEVVGQTKIRFTAVVLDCLF